MKRKSSTTPARESIAYGYTRVSTDQQVESGLSLEHQEGLIRDYYRLRLERQPITWGQLFVEEGVSAFRNPLPLRPQGQLLDAILQRGDHVIFAKIDRAFRSIVDFASTVDRWHARGVGIHLLDLGVDTTTPGGKLVATIMAAIAEWESRRIGERIVAALEVRRAQGRATNGTPPIGWRKTEGKVLVADDRERLIGQAVLALREGGARWRVIADQLNAEGIATRPLCAKRRERGQGLRWRGDAVRRWGRAAKMGFPVIGVETKQRRA